MLEPAQIPPIGRPADLIGGNANPLVKDCGAGGAAHVEVGVFDVDLRDLRSVRGRAYREDEGTGGKDGLEKLGCRVLVHDFLRVSVG